MLITGCHRSGTSLLAAVVAQCAVEERSNDLEPLVDNPKGYFESHTLRNCNDHLLASIGYSWHRPPLHPLAWSSGDRLRLLVEQRPLFRPWGSSCDWVDKDPRLCLTFGAFEHILLERAPLAISLRAPQEVAYSLFKRDGISVAKGLLIWWLYNRCISIELQPGDPIVLYQELLDWPQGSSNDNGSLNTLWEWMQRHLNNRTKLGHDPDSLRQQSLSLIEPSLQRSEQNLETESDLSKQLLELCDSIYSSIARAPTSNRLSVMRRNFDAIPGWLANAYEAVLNLGEPDLEYVRSQPANRSEELKEEVLSLKRSTSWRLTQPLRWLGDAFKG